MSLPLVTGTNNSAKQVSKNAWNNLINLVNGLANEDNSSISMASYDDLNDLFDSLKIKRFGGKLTVNQGNSTVTNATVVIINHPDLHKIRIVGTTAAATISSVGAITSAAAFNHSVVLNLAGGHTASVGHYVRIAAGAIANDDSCWLEGCWRITALAGNAATVRVTDARAALPAPTVSNVAATIMKSIQRWDSTVCAGLSISGTASELFKDIVFDGQYDNSLGAVDSAKDGLSIVTSYHVPQGITDESSVGGASIGLPGCYFVRWQSNGVYVCGSGSSVDLGSGGACSNGWRGAQATQNGSIFCKSSVTNGNRKSGLEFELGGCLNPNNGTSAGNGEQGVYGNNGGSCVGTVMRFVGNDTDVEVKDGGHVNLDGSKMRSAGANHVKSRGPGSQVCVDGVVTANATTSAFYSDYAGTIYARSSAPTVNEATAWRTDADNPGSYVCINYFGPTVVQTTSKSNGVPLNARFGRITTHAASLAAGTPVRFTVTNDQLGAYDTVDLALTNGATDINYWVDAVQPGSYRVNIKNNSASSDAQAYTFNQIIRGIAGH